jgi:hypothetical protein
MSNFSRVGKRASVRKDNKKRYKEVINILGDLDIIAENIIKSEVQVTEDNLKGIAESYTDRPIGELELSLLLSKLKQFQGALEDKRVEVHENNN